MKLDRSVKSKSAASLPSLSLLGLWTRVVCLVDVIHESVAAFACLHLSMLHVCFCSVLSSRTAYGISKEGCWRRETSTAHQRQLSSAADEEISNRRRQEEGQML